MRSKSGPGGTLYHYDLCELAQRQAVLMRKDKSPIRAIKSDRAKVVMTAGCNSRIFDFPNYIYNPREIGNLANKNLGYREVGGFGKIPKISLFKQEIDKICRICRIFSYINPLQEYFAEDFLVSIKIIRVRG